MWPLLMTKIFGPRSMPKKFEGFPKEMALRPSQIRASAAESALMIPDAFRYSDEYANLKMPVIIVAGEEVAVFRQRDGKIFATQDRCPHRRGPLSEGIVGGNKVICPLHAHQFDLETGKGNESIECVELYHVEEVNGQMLLSMESVPV